MHMSNDKIDVNYISKLAKIGLTVDEAEEFEQQLSTIVKYCEKINSADVENVPPMLHAFSDDDENAWTDDCAHVVCDGSILLKNSENIRDNQIVVHKVV